MEIQKINLRLPKELYDVALQLAERDMISLNAFLSQGVRNWVEYRLRDARRSAVSPVAINLPSPGSARDVPKVAANQLCPCGSGKKYKRCHGAAGR